MKVIKKKHIVKAKQFWSGTHTLPKGVKRVDDKFLLDDCYILRAGDYIITDTEDKRTLITSEEFKKDYVEYGK